MYRLFVLEDSNINQDMLKYLDGESWSDRAKRLGMFLGYPDCCIDAFITEDYLNRPVSKFFGTGYVPCEKCNDLSEDEIIAKISSNRKANTDFPIDPWDDGTPIIIEVSSE